MPDEELVLGCLGVVVGLLLTPAFLLPSVFAVASGIVPELAAGFMPLDCNKKNTSAMPAISTPMTPLIIRRNGSRLTDADARAGWVLTCALTGGLRIGGLVLGVCSSLT